jgi:hypothetical protein
MKISFFYMVLNLFIFIVKLLRNILIHEQRGNQTTLWFQIQK